MYRGPKLIKQQSSPLRGKSTLLIEQSAPIAQVQHLSILFRHFSLFLSPLLLLTFSWRVAMGPDTRRRKCRWERVNWSRSTCRGLIHPPPSWWTRSRPWLPCDTVGWADWRSRRSFDFHFRSMTGFLYKQIKIRQGEHNTVLFGCTLSKNKNWKPPLILAESGRMSFLGSIAMLSLKSKYRLDWSDCSLVLSLPQNHMASNLD